MNNRAFTISFIVALLAVAMVYSYVSSTEESLKQQYGSDQSVVVAKENIKELDILNETNLSIKSVPSSYAQPGSARTLEELTGSLAIAPIQKGEQITKSKVTQLGARTGLARQIAVGKRAVTVRVNDESGVARLIKPGDRVDVLTMIEIKPGHKELSEVRTVLQDVLVLATGKYIANTVPGILESDPLAKGARQKVNLTEYTSYSNVTIEVDPIQAQQMIFIQSVLNGVFLTLRNNDDNMKEELVNVRMMDVLGPNSAISRDQQAAADQQRQQALLQQQADQTRQRQQQQNPGFQMLAPPGAGRK
jgi:pilus assembly protein CpaB